MRWLTVLIGCSLLLSPPAQAAEGSVLKVLPQFLDKKGLASVSPRLYNRDAYQALLRRIPARRSTLRFAVQWKAKAPETEPLKLRVELIGAALTNAPQRTMLEHPVRQHHWFSHWTNLTLSREQYKSFGDVTAWRVTLWDGDKLLGEQKSFLWQ
jgi:hypothetical protein